MDGLQRAIIDLEHAILFASSHKKAQGLKTFVFGHSWSGFASANTLNVPEVRERVDALATIAGFNSFWGVMREQGVRRGINVVKLAKPFAYLGAMFKYGKYATMHGITGINKYDGPVYVAHSKDDNTVPFKFSIARRKDKCTNKKAEFHIFEDRGHTIYRPIECEKAINESREGKEPLKNIDDNVFTHFMNDRYRFSTRENVFGLDEKMMDEIESFFEKQGDIC